MLGQDDLNPTKESSQKGSYNLLTPLNKIAILLAGPLANFLLALIIYFFIALNYHQVLLPKIGSLLKDSPAFNSELKVKDEILLINNIKITKWEDISEAIKISNTTLNLYVKRENTYKTIFITPKIMTSTNIFKEKIQKKMIGISPSGEYKQINTTIIKSIIIGYDKLIQASTLIFKGLSKLVSGVIAPKEIGSIVAIVDVTAQATQIGALAVFSFMALISVNLGVLNLLPIPALDGGHIMFSFYEMIFRKKPNKQVFIYMTIFGWILLLSIMLLGVFNDISRLLG
jgi:regulator of sigma E protease